MEKIRKTIKDNSIILIFLVIIAIMILIICKFDMFRADEYNYSHITWTSHKLTSISDVLESVKLIWEKWSGRIPVQFAVQFLLFTGVDFYYILNSLIFVIFIIMICKIFGKRISLIQIFAIINLYLFTCAEFWQKFIWLSGSINYLWTVTLMLIVMYYFYNTIIKDKKLSKIDVVLLLVISFFAGWSQENTAFVLGSFLLVISIVNIKKLFKLPKKEKITLISSIILFGIGAILLIFAPGNFNRLGDGGLKLNYHMILNNLFDIKYLILLYLISIIVLVIKYKNYKLDIKHELLYFILPALIGAIPMLFIREFPSRAMLSYETVIIICLVNNIYIIKKSFESKNNVRINKLICVCTVILGIIGIGSLSHRVWFAYKYIEPYKKEMINQLQYCKYSGMNDAIITQFDNIEKAKSLKISQDIFPEVSDISITNSYCATYYEFNSIFALPKNYSLIEINITNEDEVIKYNLINKKTKEIMYNRIVKAENQLPNTDYKNRICFLIKNEDIDNVILDIPNDVISKITSARILSICNIKQFDVNNILE